MRRALVNFYRGTTDVDFVPWWRRMLVLSVLLMVVSVGSLAVRGLNLGIEFVGGISWEVRAPEVTTDQVREALAPFGLGGTKVQFVGGDILRVQAPSEAQPQQAEITDALVALTGNSDVSEFSVGPTWGAEITSSALRALVFFLIGVLGWLSLRLEWKMAVGAICAVLHDVVLSVGVYSLFQFEVTPPTVIAFLTILGYSIYDTVVVFDKVQENQARTGLASRLTYTQMASLSMNQVLTRSINTSVTSLLPVVSMLVVGAGILGAVALQEFSLALAVGMLSGTYSSIFIATPVVVWLKEREPRNRQLRERLATQRQRELDGTGGRQVPVAASVSTDTAGPEAPEPTSSRSGEASRPASGSSGAIPPRPRKKGRKR